MRLLHPAIALFVFALYAAFAPAADEYIVLSGGPALRSWENLRRESDQHDKGWANFIGPARIRLGEIRKQAGPSAILTWMVYRPAYAKRSAEEGRSLLSLIEDAELRAKYGNYRIVWFDSGDDVIRYLNGGHNRREVKIANFEYYGHSNRWCFMFDYSCEIMGACKAWLHENDLRGLRRGAFAKDAYCKSWGCHTGESMAQLWRKATGVRMIGAKGKTDYTHWARDRKPALSPGSRWID